MKTISVKIDEAVFKELNIRRGRESFSNYLRGMNEGI
jgi:predicted CopG family antitoxin